MDSDQSELTGTRMPVDMVDKRVVTIGGGTAPLALLSHLKDYSCSVTAIVTMADSSGSSRRLMDEFGQLPLGDLRQALVALSCKGAWWRTVFTSCFRSADAPKLEEREDAGNNTAHDGLVSGRMHAAAQSGAAGHSLGNLIISALGVIQ
jgi:2-phospho-L-lactate transferase/gluconeogenesis factor (CofD/UPF0052 family)